MYEINSLICIYAEYLYLERKQKKNKKDLMRMKTIKENTENGYEILKNIKE